MGITFTSDTVTNNVLSYTSSFDYTVFKFTKQAKFQFVGQTSKSTPVDATKVVELKNLLSANTLPSSFLTLNNSSDPTNSGFLSFIDTNASKGYLISKMRFTVTADDNNGTLQISATMPSSYSPNNSNETFNITYTNLNKAKNYSFIFKPPTELTNRQGISSILPSAVTDRDIINYFISYIGFSSNDFTINKVPDDEKGALLVSINLDKKYANQLGNGSFGFTNYTANKIFSGFMTKNQYNQRFDVQFVGDSQLMYLK